MPSDEQILIALQYLGFTLYEAKAYLTLVSLGPKGAAEISLLSDIPRSKVYGALNDLQEKELIYATKGRPTRYIAVSPKEKLNPIVEKLDLKVKDCEEVMENLVLKFESTKYMRRGEYSLRSEVWEIKGREENIQFLNEVTDKAEKTIKLITTENGIIRIYKSHFDNFEELKNRKIVIKMIAPIKEGSKSIAKELKDIVKLKSCDKFPRCQFCIIDSKDLFITEFFPDDVNIKSGSDIGLWMPIPLLAKTNEILFESFWSNLPSI